MEVILIKDLKRKGTFGDIIEVADGYARNYLIPNGFALFANNANKKRFEEMKEKALSKVSEERDALQKTANEINGKVFTMTSLSRDGKLYGSITPSIIVNEMIHKSLPDLTINASDVIIEEGNIKFVGTYACKAQFTKDISASFSIIIESDESDEQPELLEAIVEEPKKKQIMDSDESNGLDDTDESQKNDVASQTPKDSDIALDTSLDTDEELTAS